MPEDSDSPGLHELPEDSDSPGLDELPEDSDSPGHGQHDPVLSSSLDDLPDSDASDNAALSGAIQNL